MPEMEADARQLVQSPTVQVTLRALDETGNLFGQAEHLRARSLPAASGDAENSEGNQKPDDDSAAAGETAQATEQVASGQTQLVQSLDRLMHEQQAAGPTQAAEENE